MTRRTPAQYDWTKLEFNEHILKKHFTPLGSRDIKYVVIHHMTIEGTGNGDALDRCYDTWQNREASAHYGVDGTLVTQFVWDKDYAWACGDTLGNLHGLHIEHANSTAGPKWLVDNATVLTGARLAANAHVVYKLGRPVDKKTLRQHDEFFSTACPGPFLGGTEWAAYVAETQRIYDEITGTTPVVVKPAQHVAVWGKPETWVLGAIGPDVTRLGERIRIWSKALGLPDPYKVGPGQPLGPADVTGLSRLQVKWGYGSKPADLALGGNSDGYPGPSSFAKLLSDSGPKPKPKPKSVTVKTVYQNVAGYNAASQPGVTGFKTHIPKLAAAIIAERPDIFNANELSNKLRPRMRPLMDKGLAPMIRSSKGTDGRYNYRDPKLKKIASGNLVTAKSAWYKRDDKQCAWTAYEKDGRRALDAVYQLEYRDGAAADDKRVEQALDFDTQLFAIARQYGIPEANVLATIDANSEAMVIAALIKRGRINALAGSKFEHATTFNGWGKGRETRIDYAVAGAGAQIVSVEVIKSVNSDHDRFVIVRQLIK